MWGGGEISANLISQLNESAAPFNLEVQTQEVRSDTARFPPGGAEKHREKVYSVGLTNRQNQQQRK